MTLAPESVVALFPKRNKPPPIWQGVAMLPGLISLHTGGENVFQHTSGESHWGFISVAPEFLAEQSRAILGEELALASVPKFIRPPRQALVELMRLDRRTYRLAETKPDVIAHREVVRALEHELIYVLVKCLTGDEAHRDGGARRRHLGVMAHFEEALASHETTSHFIPEFAAAIGTPERLLRKCCRDFLGMGPGRYVRLRRLHLARSALRRADPAVARVGTIAKQYGFSELGRFAVAYRMTFGEPPSVTLHDSGSKIREDPNLHSGRLGFDSDCRLLWASKSERTKRKSLADRRKRP
jgi:AraC-like DNA-binding protein